MQSNSAMIGKSMSIPRGKREGAAGCKPAHPCGQKVRPGARGMQMPSGLPTSRALSEK